MGEIDKITVEVPLDEIVGVVEAYETCDKKYKEFKKLATEWEDSRNSFREVIVQYLKTHADKPANVYIGKINGKSKVRYLIVDQDKFDRTKFGESHPDLLDAYTVKVIGASTRFTVSDDK